MENTKKITIEMDSVDVPLSDSLKIAIAKNSSHSSLNH